MFYLDPSLACQSALSNSGVPMAQDSLVFWPEENSVRVVPCKRLLEGVLLWWSLERVNLSSMEGFLQLVRHLWLGVWSILFESNIWVRNNAITNIKVLTLVAMQLNGGGGVLFNNANYRLHWQRVNQ